jgi:hypothetical protein
MSLALHALKRSALFGIMELFAPLTAIRPELWDNLDVDRAFRDMSRSSGLPAEYLIDEDMVAEGRAARAQAAQQQQMAQAGLELAKSQPEMIANVANQIIPGAAPPAAA